MDEIWKEISWYEWRYWISNYWNVKSRFQQLKTEQNKMWYHRIKFYGSGWKFDKKTFQIHRLVYCTFNNIPIKFDWINLICHKDNNQMNNKLENLYLWIQKDNMRQCSLDWRVKIPSFKWSINPGSKLCEYEVKIIKKLLHKEVPQVTIAYAFDISKSVINSIHKWRQRNHVSR